MSVNPVEPLQEIPSQKSGRKRNRLTIIGSCELGGKAKGLAAMNEMLDYDFEHDEFPDIEVSVPDMTVICTDVFDAFMERNDLYKIVASDLADDRIAHVFQRADLPFEILGDLRALIERVHTPLAIRSSSLLEDSTNEPFAGIYATKMTPNNQFDPNMRFRKLVEAIKFVYASTYFKSAEGYRRATHHRQEDEKMAVIVQEVLGEKYNDRFYPALSGVLRSYNFYPSGRARNEDGVVNLALGLGKTIVDGEPSWAFSPAYPDISPPYRSIGDLLEYSQNQFWAINMGDPPAYDPINEVEYLINENLTVAEKDGTLRYLVSTFDIGSGRLNIGMGTPGPRVINFAPLLSFKQPPLNNLIKALQTLCEAKLESPVEIEFAMNFNPHHFGFLQVRPMVVSADPVDMSVDGLVGGEILLASENVLGNGVREDILDIVFLKPETFESKHTRLIADELDRINQNLIHENRPYLLIVFGRLGSFDPWLGIPVNWGQVSGAKTIIEATQENFKVEMSQGSHFFHNLINLRVAYFSVPFSSNYQIDWVWLNAQEIIKDTEFVRLVRLKAPLSVKVDGRSGRGVIQKPREIEDERSQ